MSRKHPTTRSRQRDFLSADSTIRKTEFAGIPIESLRWIPYGAADYGGSSAPRDSFRGARFRGKQAECLKRSFQKIFGSSQTGCTGFSRAVGSQPERAWTVRYLLAIRDEEGRCRNIASRAIAAAAEWRDRL